MRDRLRVRAELTRKVLRGSSRPDQLHHLPPELRRVGHPESRHLGHLHLKPRGVHETGSTSALACAINVDDRLVAAAIDTAQLDLAAEHQKKRPRRIALLKEDLATLDGPYRAFIDQCGQIPRREVAQDRAFF